MEFLDCRLRIADFEMLEPYALCPMLYALFSMLYGYWIQTSVVCPLSSVFCPLFLQKLRNFGYQFVWCKGLGHIVVGPGFFTD